MRSVEKLKAAAIPYRRKSKHELEVMLVTSRRRGRWVLPKGNVRRGLAPSKVAALEAFEEAGVLGVVSRFSLGFYRHRKSGEAGETISTVEAFPMAVNAELLSWPEKAVRQRKWMSIQEATEAVNDSELRTVLQQFAAEYRDEDRAR